VLDTGGKPDVLITAGPHETLAQPQLVGDGRTLLYAIRAGRTFNEGQIVVQPIDGGERRVLVEGGTDARVVSTGHLIWMRDDIVYGQPIDLGTLRLAGGPVAVIEGVRLGNNSGAGQYSVADNGTIVYAPGSSDAGRDLVWVDRSGHEEPTGAPAQSYTYPRVSPDGTRVAAATTDGDEDLWIWDFGRKTMTKLTAGPDMDTYPVWTPDSRSIVFRSGPAGGSSDVYRRAADGTGTLERLTNSPDSKSPQMVLADGQRVLVRTTSTDNTPSGTMQILPLKPGAPATPVLPKLKEVNAEISPDGRWILYQSSEGSTHDEIHVRPFPDTDAGHWQISSGGGSRPLWSRTGREIFFLGSSTTSSELLRVEVEPTPVGGSFRYGTASALFSLAPYIRGGLGRSWDISIDDKRFLVVKPTGVNLQTHDSINVVTHWFDELAAQVRAK